jgi:hypothetical protein
MDGLAPCPFESGICRTSWANLLLDTGYVDSHYSLGINSLPQDRILWRNVLTCGPLETLGFNSSHTTSAGTYTRYHYGTLISDSLGLDNLTFLNYTYEVQDLETQYDNANPLRMGNDYRLA